MANVWLPAVRNANNKSGIKYHPTARNLKSLLVWRSMRAFSQCLYSSELAATTTQEIASDDISDDLKQQKSGIRGTAIHDLAALLIKHPA